MEYQKIIETLNGAQWNPIHEKIESLSKKPPVHHRVLRNVKTVFRFLALCKGLQGAPLPGAGPVRRRIRLSSRWCCLRLSPAVQ